MQGNDMDVTALLVEDEPALADELRELLQLLWPGLRIVGHARSGLEALVQLAQHTPDILFLDIQVPDPNGLELAKLVGDRCHIVFVTAYDAHALQAFDNGAVDYVLKPVDPARFALTVQRLKARVLQTPRDLTRIIESVQPAAGRAKYLRWITASVGHSIRLVTVDEIVFFQSDQKYTRVVLADSEVLIKRTLKDLMSELDPEQFWQTHRSTVVNAMEIASIEPKLDGQLAVRLKNRREQLPVAESFVRRFRQM
jgi:DNA-binding LytR/AlgR family response regulator